MATAVEPELKDAFTIVTGGNKGIGLEIALGLMARGAHVVLASRDTRASEAAMAQLTSKGLPGSCSCAALDLEDLASVRQFAKQQQDEMKRRGAALKVLVNNAGVMGVGFSESGMDRHLTCNHVGPFLLTNLLHGSMSRGSRVVNIASRAHYNGQLRFNEEGELDKGSNVWWLSRYCNSKLANVVFTCELQRRWGPEGITCVSVSPGFVASSIFTNLPWPLNRVLQPIVPYVARTPAKGAETAIWAASSPDVTGNSEQLFVHDCKPLRPLAVARDEHLGKLLWDWSEKLVGNLGSSS